MKYCFLLLQEDIPPIVLNTDSLRQFSDTLDYDFDAVVSVDLELSVDLKNLIKSN